jgi:phospholipid/cholesterol/gamma-HCH transport system substrate-binding protein
VITRGVKTKLMAFLVLSAVGIVYVTASYLGFVDKVLGRRLDLHVTLPESAGLYVGSEVTDRGVKIGKVSGMRVIPSGVRVDLELAQGTKLPLDAPVYVHNLSAVGEQYLDFEPTSGDGPFAAEGDTIRGSRQSLPVDEGDLLVQLNQLVRSVNRDDLRTVVRELGAMFHDTGHPLQTLIDNGDTFVRTAQANRADTVRLLDNGLRVLRTQQRQGDNIRSFARDLADVTGALSRSDGDLRGLLDRGGASAREMDSMLRELEPTLPVLLANLVTVNQVVTPRLSAVEQLLVTFPRMIASGFTGTPGDGYGHINLQLAGDPQPCRRGYMPPNQWRGGGDLTDRPVYAKAHCASGPPYNMRGSKYAPSFPSPDGANGRAAPLGAVDASAAPQLGALGGEQALFGDDSWKWLLIGPVKAR